MPRTQTCPRCHLASLAFARLPQQFVCTSSECSWTGRATDESSEPVFEEVVAHLAGSLRSGLAVSRGKR